MQEICFSRQNIHAAQFRINNYPNIEKTWPVWILSESNIKEVAAQFGLDIEGLDPDLMVHNFKKIFMPMIDSGIMCEGSH